MESELIFRELSEATVADDLGKMICELEVDPKGIN